MTISELIEILKQFDGDMEVMTSAPSHDYWGTIQALDINSVNTALVTRSDYHNSDKVVEDYNDDDTREVVLIS